MSPLNIFRFPHGAITVEEAEWERLANCKMTVQDLLELLLTLPEEARKITMVEVPEMGYDSIMGWLTRNGVEFHRSRSLFGERWTLKLTGDTYPQERKE